MCEALVHERGDIPSLRGRNSASPSDQDNLLPIRKDIKVPQKAPFSKVSFRGIKDLHMRGKNLIYIQRNIENQVDNLNI